MCRTVFWKSPYCGHCWLELDKPCKEGMNLLTCADFSEDESRTAKMPGFPGHWAPPDECPQCDYKEYDMRRRRMCQMRRYGYRIGTGASKTQPGFDLICCNMM
ncbi:hypothetical protein BAUCODRAFT_119757 [Baudoinia panamericana UAMH 10762]|uniref:Uncharacterized protein n=1 Tax=Baudoinia panamericana (strain UAMH 10762) TaxID=717646 RepID=M2NM06_BAUPA|nr:uncharacterized protein BAUCODRAFT_119757 [Baudoinia panamericana UAMH 10762]EMD00206.1 hypothetical protein BAUCODRAFT_119757 [Baudoinia panamericana UAMH 10762]